MRLLEGRSNFCEAKVVRLTAAQLSLLKDPFQDDDAIDMIEGFLQHIDSGRHRAAFMLPSGRTIIKVPLCREGVDANVQEARFSSIYPRLVARTRMFGHSALQVALNEPRFLDSRVYWGNAPKSSWTIEEQNLYWDMANVVLSDRFTDEDVLQAGRNTKGRLVMYDCNEF